MKRKSSLLTPSLKLASVLILGCGASVSAQTILSVDFGSVNNPAAQTDFVVFNTSENATAGPIVRNYTNLNLDWTASGSVSVTLASGTNLAATGNMIARNRTGTAANSGSFTYNALYRDLVIAQNSANMRIGITGLNANTYYDVRIYAYDHDNAGTALFANATGTNTVSDTISWTAGGINGANPDENLRFSTVLRVLTDSNGSLIIANTRQSGGSNQAIINGIEIAAIPEPATAGVLFSVGALGAALARRRRVRMPAGC